MPPDCTNAVTGPFVATAVVDTNAPATLGAGLSVPITTTTTVVVPQGVVDDLRDAGIYSVDGTASAMGTVDGVSRLTSLTVDGYELAHLHGADHRDFALDLDSDLGSDDERGRQSRHHHDGESRLPRGEGQAGRQGQGRRGRRPAVTGMVKLVLMRNGVKVKQALVEVNGLGRAKQAFKSITKAGTYAVVVRFLGSPTLARSSDKAKVVV